MNTTKLTGRENLTKYTFWLGPVGPTDKENQVRVYMSTVLGTLPLWNGKVEKHDPDPDRIQSEKQDPDQMVWIRNTADTFIDCSFSICRMVFC